MYSFAVPGRLHMAFDAAAFEAQLLLANTLQESSPFVPRVGLLARATTAAVATTGSIAATSLMRRARLSRYCQ